MATESPIRMLETSGKWPSPKETATFAPSSSSMAAEELSLLLTDHRFFGNGRDVAPNRSGSAPPSMEGSFAAIENLMSPQNSSLNARYANLNSLIENCEPEEQLRADPAYLAYYCSKINLNPRLPPPLISWENRRLVRHIGSFGNKSEDDRSPQKPSDDWEDQSSAFWSGQDAAFLAGQHRSSVDLIQYTISFIGNVKQVTTTLCLFTLKKSKPLFKNGIHWEMHYKSSDDFPRTPSPVYNQSRSLIHGSPGKTVEHDADSSSLHDSSVGTSNLVASTLVTDNLGPSSNANPAIAPVSNSLSLDGTGSTPPSPALIERDAHNLDVHLEDDVLIGGITVSDFVSTESKMKDSNTSSLPNSGNKKNQEDWHHNRQKNWLQHQVHQQQGNSFQVQGAKSQMVFQGTNHTNINMDQYLHGSSKFSTEAQPVLQSSGFTPPLYATAAAYMTSANPFYPNLQPPAGYPPHGAIPLAFDNTVGPSFNAQTSAVSTGESITQGVDMQHLNKFYGQLGYAPQPSFADPLYMQYFQQPFGDVYSVSGQFDPLVSRGGVIGSQVSAFETHRESDVASCSVDKKLQHQRSGGLTNLNHRRGGIASPNYHGSPTNMGMLMQFPTSPLASPVLPRSPAGVTCLPGGRNEIRYPPGSGKNVGIFSGWQGQRGYDDPKTHSFLEELKSGKGRRFELSDIAGHIIILYFNFSADQHGSRFIQQKLENCSVEEKASVFKEVLPHASKLMTDVFGNYVIQKFFEHGNPEQRKELASQLAGQILPLSLQMYGCRVIQKVCMVLTMLICSI
ncbi:Pumilio-like 5 [Vitis vinifera]|uniref:Pumilio-like 5 n=1 Tax=Vitis vinifera TaxID=29760 RepID=A0A438GLV7_VITVI|nr:Pumilio-like 5 [Vitis vinifera]